MGREFSRDAGRGLGGLMSTHAHIGIKFKDGGIHGCYVHYDGGSITGNLNITGSVTTTGNLTINGNATVAGTLTAQEFHTEFVSASIMFSSGSNIFGDAIRDKLDPRLRGVGA